MAKPVGTALWPAISATRNHNTWCWDAKGNGVLHGPEGLRAGGWREDFTCTGSPGRSRRRSGSIERRWPDGFVEELPQVRRQHDGGDSGLPCAFASWWTETPRRRSRAIPPGGGGMWVGWNTIGRAMTARASGARKEQDLSRQYRALLTPRHSTYRDGPSGTGAIPSTRRPCVPEPRPPIQQPRRREPLIDPSSWETKSSYPKLCAQA